MAIRLKKCAGTFGDLDRMRNLSGPGYGLLSRTHARVKVLDQLIDLTDLGADLRPVTVVIVPLGIEFLHLTSLLLDPK